MPAYLQHRIQSWDKLYIKLIGKYRMTPNKGGRKYIMKGKKEKDIYLQAITMIDPSMGLIEIYSVQEFRADLVAIQVKSACLTRYCLPNKIMIDRGKNFFQNSKFIMVNDYGTPYSPISTRNLQVKIIVESIHQNIGDVRTLGKELSHQLPRKCSKREVHIFT